MVEVKKLFKKYNSKTVVEDVSIEIVKGKITSFIGPNGAGKSTVLSMISRLITRDSGEVLIDGKDMGNSIAMNLLKRLPS